MTKGRVLIIDDDIDDDSKSRRLLQDLLTIMEFETVLANNGEEALEILSEDLFFDLIITDVMMPYITGFDLTKKLKGYAQTKGIPIIATSAFHDWKKARKEDELQVDGFVPKPITKQALMTEIKKVMSG